MLVAQLDLQSLVKVRKLHNNTASANMRGHSVRALHILGGGAIIIVKTKCGMHTSAATIPIFFNKVELHFIFLVAGGNVV